MKASMQPGSTEAEKLEAEFKNLVYSLSHDLSSPLRGMVEFSRLLKEEHATSLNDEAKSYLSFIVESGEKAQSMLTALSNYALLDTATKFIPNISLDDVLNQCKIHLSEKIDAANANLTIAPLPLVMGDKERLKILFITLIDNSLKFHAAQTSPVIDISVKDSGPEWIFTIRDNGLGIKEAFYKKAFQPFGRLHADDKYPGVGMGLTTAKKIVEKHDGRIWLEPSPMQGLSVNFTLPKIQTGTAP